MWMIEAKTAGEDAQFFRYGPANERVARKIHSDLTVSGEWDVVRVWSIEAELKQKESDARILAWAKEIEDGVGEGQPL